ncbi:uncharacterized protein [Procambarus clarkii]|uniref:uncharacterized protein n=1 Tax=Procambarus clarkii TaxID=6728 RepID=UPI0037449A69
MILTTQPPLFLTIIAASTTLRLACAQAAAPESSAVLEPGGGCSLRTHDTAITCRGLDTTHLIQSLREIRKQVLDERRRIHNHSREHNDNTGDRSLLKDVVREVSYYKCVLPTLTQHTLFTPSRLDTVTIVSSGIREVNVGAFDDHAHTLVHLDLSYNLLTVVPEVTANLTRLEVLDLRHNQIAHLPKESVLSSLASLRQLHLDHNKLGQIASAQPEVGWRMFNLNEVRESLTYLSLAHNALTSLPELFTKPCLTLANLDLSYNNISEMEGGWLRNMARLHQLDLSNNLLQSVLPQHLSSSIIYINLAGNPWSCDCASRWLLHSGSHNTTTPTVTSPTCSSPLHLRHRKLTLLTESEVCRLHVPGGESQVVYVGDEVEGVLASKLGLLHLVNVTTLSQQALVVSWRVDAGFYSSYSSFSHPLSWAITIQDPQEDRRAARVVRMSLERFKEKRPDWMPSNSLFTEVLQGLEPEMQYTVCLSLVQYYYIYIHPDNCRHGTTSARIVPTTSALTEALASVPIGSMENYSVKTEGVSMVNEARQVTLSWTVTIFLNEFKIPAKQDTIMLRPLGWKITYRRFGEDNMTEVVLVSRGGEPVQNFTNHYSVKGLQPGTGYIFCLRSLSDEEVRTAVFSSSGEVHNINPQAQSQVFLAPKLSASATQGHTMQVDVDHLVHPTFNDEKTQLLSDISQRHFLSHEDLKSQRTNSASPSRGSTPLSQSQETGPMFLSKENNATLPSQGSIEVFPSQGSTTLLPSQGSTTLLPSQGSTTLLPSQGSTTLLPLQGSTTLLPSQGSTTLLPSQGSTTLLPSQGSTTLLPSQGSTTLLPSQGSTTLLPSQGSTTLLPSQGSTTLLPSQGSTTLLPSQGSTTLLPSQGSTTTFSVQGSHTGSPFKRPYSLTGHSKQELPNMLSPGRSSAVPLNIPSVPSLTQSRRPPRPQYGGHFVYTSTGERIVLPIPSFGPDSPFNIPSVVGPRVKMGPSGLPISSSSSPVARNSRQRFIYEFDGVPLEKTQQSYTYDFTTEAANTASSSKHQVQISETRHKRSNEENISTLYKVNVESGLMQYCQEIITPHEEDVIPLIAITSTVSSAMAVVLVVMLWWCCLRKCRYGKADLGGRPTYTARKTTGTTTSTPASVFPGNDQVLTGSVITEGNGDLKQARPLMKTSATSAGNITIDHENNKNLMKTERSSSLSSSFGYLTPLKMPSGLIRDPVQALINAQSSIITNPHFVGDHLQQHRDVQEFHPGYDIPPTSSHKPLFGYDYPHPVPVNPIGIYVDKNGRLENQNILPVPLPGRSVSKYKASSETGRYTDSYSQINLNIPLDQKKSFDQNKIIDLDRSPDSNKSLDYNYIIPENKDNMPIKSKGKLTEKTGFKLMRDDDCPESQVYNDHQFPSTEQFNHSAPDSDNAGVIFNDEDSRVSGKTTPAKFHLHIGDRKNISHQRLSRKEQGESPSIYTHTLTGCDKVDDYIPQQDVTSRDRNRDQARNSVPLDASRARTSLGEVVLTGGTLIEVPEGYVVPKPAHSVTTLVPDTQVQYYETTKTVSPPDPQTHIPGRRSSFPVNKGYADKGESKITHIITPELETNRIIIKTGSPV